MNDEILKEIEIVNNFLFIDYYNNKRIQERLGFFASKWF